MSNNLLQYFLFLQVTDEQSKSILEGRIIIEKKTVAENLWCHTCDKPLSLRQLQEEQFKGIVGIWHIKCHYCNIIVKVQTGKRSNKGHYDTNLKSAIGRCIESYLLIKMKKFISSKLKKLQECLMLGQQRCTHIYLH